MSRNHPLLRFFASLKLAVFCLLSLSALLATATVLESLYGMRGAYVLVYGTWWFYGVLFLLGLNVLCAALVRFPWKVHQTGFVITHLGILTILFGSVLTRVWGVDANLPVVEGSAEDEVVLTNLQLEIIDEESGKKQAFPIPETARRSDGKLLQVQFDPETEIRLKAFLPRANFQKRVVDSPVPGMGTAALQVEIFNDRFDVQPWLKATQVAGPTEMNFGPATLSFEKAWFLEREKEFLKGTPIHPSEPDGKRGYLLVQKDGREFKIDVERAEKDWQDIGTASLRVKVDRYLPYAIVRDNKLVNKSQDPVNPAIQLRLRDAAGYEEKHTIFANFPEFATLHRRPGGQTRPAFGLKILMISNAVMSGPTTAAGLQARGRLEFLQSHDDKSVYYRIWNSARKMTGQGQVKVGTEVPTGWMNLKFRVSQWFAHSVEVDEPIYIDQLSGNGANFGSAVQLGIHSGRNPAAPEDFWLSEGGGKVWVYQGRKFLIRYAKETLRLPFAVHLEKFRMGVDPGTTKAASYESIVRVDNRAPSQRTGAPQGSSHLIAMNEPLKYGGYTFYQASYQMEEGRPPISVFSVNSDPGRWAKYLGSIIMILGIAIMFYLNPHYWGKIFSRK